MTLGLRKRPADHSQLAAASIYTIVEAVNIQIYCSTDMADSNYTLSYLNQMPKYRSCLLVYTNRSGSGFLFNKTPDTLNIRCNYLHEENSSFSN